jgi:two-component system, NarL family, sensor histidine kinase UhpB
MIMWMKLLSRLRFRYHAWLLRLPIFNRLLIGNSIVIIFGAVFGTILTRQLTLMGNLGLILIFSLSGIMLTLLVNYLIIKTALDPLHELCRALERMEVDQTVLPDFLNRYEDPDIQNLVKAINALLQRIESHTEMLRAISERAINAHEEERVRIARGLHDDTAQAISMLIIHLERLEKSIPDGNPVLTQRTVEARQLATRLLDDLRDVIWNLRPSILDDLGLVPAIRWYAQDKLGRLGTEVSFDIPGETIRLPSHLETMFFRIAQEAVSNILHHAQAKSVIIGFHQQKNRVCLEIKDDGRGFQVDQIASEALSRKQLGLLGIRERVSLVSGEVKVESAPGLGTRLQISVPLLGRNPPELQQDENPPYPGIHHGNS